MKEINYYQFPTLIWLINYYYNIIINLRTENKIKHIDTMYKLRIFQFIGILNVGYDYWLYMIIVIYLLN